MKRRWGNRSPSVILRYFSLYMNPSTRQHPLPGSPSSAREERAMLEGWGQEQNGDAAGKGFCQILCSGEAPAMCKPLVPTQPHPAACSAQPHARARRVTVPSLFLKHSFLLCIGNKLHLPMHQCAATTWALKSWSPLAGRAADGTWHSKGKTKLAWGTSLFGNKRVTQQAAKCPSPRRPLPLMPWFLNGAFWLLTTNRERSERGFSRSRLRARVLSPRASQCGKKLPFFKRNSVSQRRKLRYHVPATACLRTCCAPQGLPCSAGPHWSKPLWCLLNVAVVSLEPAIRGRGTRERCGAMSRRGRQRSRSTARAAGSLCSSQAAPHRLGFGLRAGRVRAAQLGCVGAGGLLTTVWCAGKMPGVIRHCVWNIPSYCGILAEESSSSSRVQHLGAESEPKSRRPQMTCDPYGAQGTSKTS